LVQGNPFVNRRKARTPCLYEQDVIATDVPCETTTLFMFATRGELCQELRCSTNLLFG
jgi:hypothetical protein